MTIIQTSFELTLTSHQLAPKEHIPVCFLQNFLNKSREFVFLSRSCVQLTTPVPWTASAAPQRALPRTPPTAQRFQRMSRMTAVRRGSFPVWKGYIPLGTAPISPPSTPASACLKLATPPPSTMAMPLPCTTAACLLNTMATPPPNMRCTCQQSLSLASPLPPE